MSKRNDYRRILHSLDDWEPYLLAESGLPGPRGNIELAQAVADEGDEPLFLRLLTFDAAVAPTNTPQEFLAFCGVVGLGQLVAEGRRDLLPALRLHANDPRWRIGLLLERRRRCMARGRQADHGALAAIHGSRCALDHATEPDQATPGACGCQLGSDLAGAACYVTANGSR